MSEKALDQKLLEQLILGALVRRSSESPQPTEGSARSELPDKNRRRVLVVDSHESSANKVIETLSALDLECVVAKSTAQALAACRTSFFELVICQLRAELVSANELLLALKDTDPDLAMLVVALPSELEQAAGLVGQGASDWLISPYSAHVLQAKAFRALELTGLRRDHRALQTRYGLLDAAAQDAESLVALSPAIQRLLTLSDRAAATDNTVLLQGEPGSGKALVARRIHARSPRRKGPFVSVHCLDIHGTDIETALFGEDRPVGGDALIGRIELAQGGTLFIDAVDALPAGAQLKLFRFLQEHRVQRLGSERSVPVNVRCIVSTTKDLRAEMEQGRFRQDLYYRLHVIPLVVPPLKDRIEDLPTLAQRFAETCALRLGRPVPVLSPQVVRALSEHHWPGNLRELKNVMEHALLTSQHWMMVGDLPPILRAKSGEETTATASVPMVRKDRPLPEILEELERQLIGEAYAKAGKVKTETARLLGVKPSALYYKLEKYGFIQKGDSAAENEEN